MATCVFTCMNWFCISRMTCLIIFSGFSARSTMSFRFARINVETRSSNAISYSFPPPCEHERIDYCVLDTLCAAAMNNTPKAIPAASQTETAPAAVPSATPTPTPIASPKPMVESFLFIAFLNFCVLRLANQDGALPSIAAAGSFRLRTIVTTTIPIQDWLRRLVADHAHLRQQILQVHSRQRLKQRRNLRGHLRNVSGNFVRSSRGAVTRRDNRDPIDLAQRSRERTNDLRHAADQFVDDGSLVVLLERFGLHVHRLRFGFTLREDDGRFRLTLLLDRSGFTFCFKEQALLLGLRD